MVNAATLWKWGCFSTKFSQTKPHVEDEKPSDLPLNLEAGRNTDDDTKIAKFHKDFNLIVEPLSSTDLISSNSDGSKIRIAYKGGPGANSEAAAVKAYPNCETVPWEDFESVFKAVELWLVDKAVVPIENSVSGSVHRNYDLFLGHRLHIVGEVQLIVNHCLLGLPGVRKEELKCVLSHPLVIDQCKIMLNRLDVVKVTTEDTAGAAKIVASNGIRYIGAIASLRQAEIYGLNILSKKIQNDSDNITRFLIVAREPIILGTNKPHKTSIVFTLEEGPGVLFRALSVFSLSDINLSKVTYREPANRPLKIVDDSIKGRTKYFNYFVYIDIEVSMAEPRAQNALRHLQEFCCFLRVLGCYPVDAFQ
uniref:arogenate dehydratase/prephenate dehydratase 1, chloroplastic-like n=1 Tax=Erigeron canadensis TaxID=72917 RepID=UPI001CB8DCB1|nr:arogenate dehydratase/prephenate dehydratase 1, chloroplastic-like [Erigeron canadensis]